MFTLAVITILGIILSRLILSDLYKVKNMFDDVNYPQEIYDLDMEIIQIQYTLRKLDREKEKLDVAIESKAADEKNQDSRAKCRLIEQHKSDKYQAVIDEIDGLTKTLREKTRKRNFLYSAMMERRFIWRARLGQSNAIFNQEELDSESLDF